MYGHRNWEPRYSFVETVRVGRDFYSNHDVTIRYTNPGQGRGEFSVEGGWIRWEEQVNGGRMLTIDTRNGHVFQITRRRGGGDYYMNTAGFWCTRPQRY